MENETPIPEGYMADSKGRLVLLEHISEYEKFKDAEINEMIDRALKLQEEISKFKAEVMGDFYALMETAYEKYEAKIGGKKGNVSVKSFDGRKKVSITVGEFLECDERLAVAKSLVDECLVDWSQGTRTELRTVINTAFEVDKKGEMSPAKVLALLKYEINDEKWLKAMKAIRDSLNVQFSKNYIRFHIRGGVDEKWQAISLNIAAL